MIWNRKENRLHSNFVSGINSVMPSHRRTRIKSIDQKANSLVVLSAAHTPLYIEFQHHHRVIIARASDRNSEWLLSISVIFTAYLLHFYCTHISLTHTQTVFLVFWWFDLVARFEFDERKVMGTKLLFAATHTIRHIHQQNGLLFVGIPSHSLMTTMTFIFTNFRIFFGATRIQNQPWVALQIGIEFYSKHTRQCFVFRFGAIKCTLFVPKGRTKFMIFNDFYYYFDLIWDTI